MWNWLATSLAVGAAIVLYDGSPLVPSPNVLWDLVDKLGYVHQFWLKYYYSWVLRSVHSPLHLYCIELQCSYCCLYTNYCIAVLEQSQINFYSRFSVLRLVVVENYWYIWLRVSFIAVDYEQIHHFVFIAEVMNWWMWGMAVIDIWWCILLLVLYGYWNISDRYVNCYVNMKGAVFSVRKILLICYNFFTESPSLALGPSGFKFWMTSVFTQVSNCIYIYIL